MRSSRPIHLTLSTIWHGDGLAAGSSSISFLTDRSAPSIPRRRAYRPADAALHLRGRLTGSDAGRYHRGDGAFRDRALNRRVAQSPGSVSLHAIPAPSPSNHEGGTERLKGTANR
jgi:hypothetical protein